MLQKQAEIKYYQAIESGDKSLNEIAKLNNINKTSIHRFVCNKDLIHVMPTNKHRLPGGGRKLSFPNCCEMELYFFIRFRNDNRLVVNYKLIREKAEVII